MRKEKLKKPILVDFPRSEKDIRRLLSNPYEWFVKANSLQYVARSLEEDLEETFKEWGETDFKNISEEEMFKMHHHHYCTHSAYLLLSGYIIENLAKGIIVAENPELFNDTSRKEYKKFMSHKFCELIKWAGIKFNNPRTKEYEQHLCVNLEKIITWAGRYPAPKLSRARESVATALLEPDIEIIKNWRKQLTTKLTTLID